MHPRLHSPGTQGRAVSRPHRLLPAPPLVDPAGRPDPDRHVPAQDLRRWTRCSPGSGRPQRNAAGEAGMNLCRRAGKLSEAGAARHSRVTTSTPGFLGGEARREDPVLGFSEAGPDRRGIRLGRDGAPSSNGSYLGPGRDRQVGRVRRGGIARNGRRHQSVVGYERLSRQLGDGRPCGYRAQAQARPRTNMTTSRKGSRGTATFACSGTSWIGWTVIGPSPGCNMRSPVTTRVRSSWYRVRVELLRGNARCIGHPVETMANHRDF